MIGFSTIRRYFDGLIAAGQLSHAYLFTGQAMIGKRTFALELAEKLGGDQLIIDPTASISGQTIGIDQVKCIRNFLALTPLLGQYKTAIINDADHLTEEAQNALLKVLEEPNGAAVLILVTANPELLLPTVRSRCQDIVFPPHPKKIAAAVLAETKLTSAQKDFLLNFANGRVGLLKNIIADEKYGRLKADIGELAQLTGAGLPERFAFAQKMSEDENKPVLEQKVLHWLLYARTRLPEPRFAGIARGLLALHQTISQPQYNSRLALENFLVNI